MTERVIRLRTACGCTQWMKAGPRPQREIVLPLTAPPAAVFDNSELSSTIKTPNRVFDFYDERYWDGLTVLEYRERI